MAPRVDLLTRMGANVPHEALVRPLTSEQMRDTVTAMRFWRRLAASKRRGWRR